MDMDEGSTSSIYSVMEANHYRSESSHPKATIPTHNHQVSDHLARANIPNTLSMIFTQKNDDGRWRRRGVLALALACFGVLVLLVHQLGRVGGRSESRETLSVDEYW
jgi:hypothetical protein